MTKKKSKLTRGMLVFMFFQLILGGVFFFASLKMIDESPYREIASILGIIVSMTSGIKIKFSNLFKDWTNQD